jgi:hypothetical protein
MSMRRAFARRLRCRRVGIAVSAVMLVAGARAWAEGPAPRRVEVSPPVCKVGYLPMVPFVDSLRVELAGRGLACCTLVEPGQGISSDGIVRVAVELDPCVSDGDRVEVVVQDSNGKVTERDVSLADVGPSARPRALALAVAELIRVLGQAPSPEPTVEKPPEPPSPEPTVEKPPAPTSASQGAPPSVHLQSELRMLPTRDTTMWGGRMRFSVPWHRLHADVDLGAGFASAHDELGDVLLRSASVGFGLGPRLTHPIAIVDLGLRAEMGWAWIRGETQSPGVRTHVGSQWISCAGLRAAIEAPAGRRLRPSLALEGGFVLYGVKGESKSQPVVGLTGYYLLAALGLAVSL